MLLLMLYSFLLSRVAVLIIAGTHRSEYKGGKIIVPGSIKLIISRKQLGFETERVLKFELVRYPLSTSMGSKVVGFKYMCP